MIRVVLRCGSEGLLVHLRALNQCSLLPPQVERTRDTRKERWRWSWDSNRNTLPPPPPPPLGRFHKLEIWVREKCSKPWHCSATSWKLPCRKLKWPVCAPFFYVWAWRRKLRKCVGVKWLMWLCNVRCSFSVFVCVEVCLSVHQCLDHDWVTEGEEGTGRCDQEVMWTRERLDAARSDKMK